MLIRDRVKDFRRVPASTVRPSPHNWRTHPKAQQDALKGVLADLGFAGAVLARELPDGTLEAIDGHLRLDTMGAAEVPVLVTDLTESEAKLLLATFDPIGAMAGADAAKLDALLREVQTDNEAVTALLEETAKGVGLNWAQGDEPDQVDDVWKGMPEFNQEDQTSAFRIIVHFDTADDLHDFGRLIGQKVTEKTRSTWHPYKPPIDGQAYEVDDES